jgi:hypothetical protein
MLIHMDGHGGPAPLEPAAGVSRPLHVRGPGWDRWSLYRAGLNNLKTGCATAPNGAGGPTQVGAGRKQRLLRAEPAWAGTKVCRQGKVPFQTVTTLTYRSFTPIHNNSFSGSGEVRWRAILRCHPRYVITSVTPMSLESLEVHIQTGGGAPSRRCALLERAFDVRVTTPLDSEKGLLNHEPHALSSTRGQADAEEVCLVARGVS